MDTTLDGQPQQHIDAMLAEKHAADEAAKLTQARLTVLEFEIPAVEQLHVRLIDAQNQAYSLGRACVGSQFLEQLEKLLYQVEWDMLRPRREAHHYLLHPTKTDLPF